jgi:hypothetical protein
MESKRERKNSVNSWNHEKAQRERERENVMARSAAQNVPVRVVPVAKRAGASSSTVLP